MSSTPSRHLLPLLLVALSTLSFLSGCGDNDAPVGQDVLQSDTQGDATQDDATQDDAAQDDATQDDVTQDMTEDIAGDAAEDVIGDVAGDALEDVTGDITGDVAEDMIEDVAGDVAGDTPGDVAGDTPGDVPVNPLCLDGDGDGTLGEACGCPEDCAGEAPRCLRNLVVDLEGQNYCSATCGGDEDCGEGFKCNPGLEQVQLDPFCERCASPTAGALAPGEACICDADCGEVEVEGRARAVACDRGVCRISPCNNFGPNRCPEGSTCESGQSEQVCVPCLNDVPAGSGEACACADDCSGSLACVDGVCRQPCEEDAECDPGEECRVQLVGEALCIETPDDCVGDGSRALGQPCQCNADCDAQAPICVTLELQGGPVSACTVRPCDTAAADACPSGAGGGAYRCCRVPLLFEATCIPQALASRVEDVAICSP